MFTKLKREDREDHRQGFKIFRNSSPCLPSVRSTGFHDRPPDLDEPCVQLGTSTAFCWPDSVVLGIFSLSVVYSFQGSISIRLLIHCHPFDSNHLHANCSKYILNEQIHYAK